jgi:hypothetical protein
MELNLSLSWSTGTKIAFRFFFIYFVLYALPFPLGWVAFTDFVWEFYNNLWLAPVAWTGKNILHLNYEITVLPNGSGDTTYNYVQVFLFALIAFTGTVIWSILDRNRPHYERLLYWFIIFLRYYLGIVLLGYGFVKVIKTQFPFPSIRTLLKPYGESTPMNLLWTFMGYSKGYNIFTGLGEITAGLLLFFKRTKVIGALMAIAVMSNVVVLNFAYDVPVKLFSSHLLFIAILLLIPDIRRLFEFFILNKAVSPAPLQPVYRNNTTRTTYIIVKPLFIGSILIANFIQSIDMQKQWGDPAERPVMYGVYDVEIFVLKGDTLPPLANDTRRWKRMIVEKKGKSSIQYMDGGTIVWNFAADTLNHTMNIYSTDSTTVYQFAYRLENNNMVLNSVREDENTHVRFVARTPENFLLLNHGFRWINEFPDNQ